MNTSHRDSGIFDFAANISAGSSGRELTGLHLPKDEVNLSYYATLASQAFFLGKFEQAIVEFDCAIGMLRRDSGLTEKHRLQEGILWERLGKSVAIHLVSTNVEHTQDSSLESLFEAAINYELDAKYSKRTPDDALPGWRGIDSDMRISYLIGVVEGFLESALLKVNYESINRADIPRQVQLILDMSELQIHHHNIQNLIEVLKLDELNHTSLLDIVLSHKQLFSQESQIFVENLVDDEKIYECKQLLLSELNREEAATLVQIKKEAATVLKSLDLQAEYYSGDQQDAFKNLVAGNRMLVRLGELVKSQEVAFSMDVKSRALLIKLATIHDKFDRVHEKLYGFVQRGLGRPALNPGGLKGIIGAFSKNIADQGADSVYQVISMDAQLELARLEFCYLLRRAARTTSQLEVANLIHTQEHSKLSPGRQVINKLSELVNRIGELCYLQSGERFTAEKIYADYKLLLMRHSFVSREYITEDEADKGKFLEALLKSYAEFKKVWRSDSIQEISPKDSLLPLKAVFPSSMINSLEKRLGRLKK